MAILFFREKNLLEKIFPILKGWICSTELKERRKNHDHKNFNRIHARSYRGDCRFHGIVDDYQPFTKIEIVR